MSSLDTEVVIDKLSRNYYRQVVDYCIVNRGERNDTELIQNVRVTAAMMGLDANGAERHLRAELRSRVRLGLRPSPQNTMKKVTGAA